MSRHCYSFSSRATTFGRPRFLLDAGKLESGL